MTIRDGVGGTVVLSTLADTNLSIGFVGTKIAKVSGINKAKCANIKAVNRFENDLLMNDLKLFVFWKVRIVHSQNQPLAFSKQK